jgi:hypothetical protein
MHVFGAIVAQRPIMYAISREGRMSYKRNDRNDFAGAATSADQGKGSGRRADHVQNLVQALQALPMDVQTAIVEHVQELARNHLRG